MSATDPAPVAAVAPVAGDARRRGLSLITAGLPVFSLAILFLLFFFDEFDTAAFNVLAINIQKTYHLTDRAFGIVVIGSLSIVLLLAVPVGYAGDRRRRVPLVVAGAITAGVFSFLTGFAGTVLVLVLYRIGNGIGRLTNDTVHPSLLADYYPPPTRPAVFATHRSAERIAAVVGPLVAGTAAWLFDWQAAFKILIVPIVAAALVATRLRDPLRGGSDDREKAERAQSARRLPLNESTRILTTVPTLKRQYIGLFFIGAGLIPLAFLIPLFLGKVFHVGPLGRGMVGSLNAAAAFAGVLVGGRLNVRWAKKDLGLPLKYAGYSLVGVGLGLIPVSTSPWLWLFVVIGVVPSFLGGVFSAPYYSTMALVSPSRVRSLSFGLSALALLVGVWVLYIIIPLSGIPDHHGLRIGLVCTVPYWIIGGFVLATAHRFVPADVAKAARDLELTAAIRDHALAGDDVLLACRGIDVAYDSVQVLFDVDLDIRRGEILALLGTNGAGKSTLLKAISGVVHARAGTVLFEGEDTTQADATACARMGIVHMPGGRSVFPTLTVAENFAAASWLLNKDKARAEAATNDMLERFPRLRERLHQPAGNLSGGEQQQLGLSMAFLAEPKLLIIDELSLGLAPTIVEQLLGLVREIHARGATVVLVEQSVNIALTIADRAYFMEKGEVRFEGRTADLLGRDDILRSVFLEGASKGSIGGTPVVTAPGNGTRKTNITLNGATSHSPALTGAVAVPALEASGVSIAFGGIKAVRDVSLAVAPGEILGIIGPNGAGKTTLFDLLSGFLSPNMGTVRLAGRDVTGLSPDRRAMLGLGRSFQDARIFPSLTVAENLATGLERHLEFRDPIADALGLPGITLQEEDIAWTVADLVELMGLGAFRDKFVSELSTGSRRVVDLAMAIAHDPSVLLLDEPSSGIAQRETEALGPLLRRIRDETGCAMIVIEHDMPLITGLSDRMLALDLGAVITSGLPADVVRDPQVIASYLGGDQSTISRSGDNLVAVGSKESSP